MKRALRFGIGFVILCGLALLVKACGTVKRFGDATVYDRWNFPFVAVDELRLPKMELDHPRTYDFKVRGLPSAIYPRMLRLGVRSDEMDIGTRNNQQWRQCELKIELRSLAGETFYSRVLRLAEPTNRWWVGADRLEIRFEVMPREPWGYMAPRPIEEPSDINFTLPQHNSYDVHVEVVHPSKNPFHKAQLFTEQLIFN